MGFSLQSFDADSDVASSCILGGRVNFKLGLIRIPQPELLVDSNKKLVPIVATARDPKRGTKCQDLVFCKPGSHG